ncbi:MAG TPA: hypothetical protein VIJ10_14365 [Vicinamibacteria bacterium]|jgi:hypothetical protein
MSKLRLAAAAVAAIALAGCEAAPLTAPNGSTLFLQVNPPFVIANGGIAVVTAVVTEPAGTLVPDGTEVLFFTNLGRIDPVGKTVRGVAAVNFVSDARSGTATVTAISGQATATLADPGLTVGSALPALVNVTCDPQRIVSPRNCRVVATVFDQRGNPVQNVPVSLSLAPGTGDVLEETLDSGGAFLYTNSNGQVTDTLRTQAIFGLGQKTVTINATTANNITGTATVFIE